MIKTNKALSLVESACPLFICLFIVYLAIRISMSTVTVRPGRISPIH